MSFCEEAWSYFKRQNVAFVERTDLALYKSTFFWFAFNLVFEVNGSTLYSTTKIRTSKFFKPKNAIIYNVTQRFISCRKCLSYLPWWVEVISILKVCFGLGFKFFLNAIEVFRVKVICRVASFWPWSPRWRFSDKSSIRLFNPTFF